MDPLDYLFSLEAFGIKFGLESIRRICDELGQPQKGFKSILIAGTNGKGSVTAFVDHGLRAAGHRVARYTSPHLTSLNERFVVDGRPVSDEALRRAAADVRDAVDRLLTGGALSTHPTFFEVTTAIGFELFRRMSVEIAVVEVGLGGRLDSTNILDPFLTAITTIDLDHEQQLGNSVASIAFEKAGIIKRSVPLVIGELAPDAMAVIESVAAEVGAPVVRAAAATSVTATVTDGLTNMIVTTPDATYGPLSLALRGRHQIDNALLAIRLLEAADALGITVGSAAITAALTQAHWPGRLDLRTDAKSRRLLIDAAHNPAGAARLAAYLQEVFPERIPLVFGAMHDKRTGGMLAELVPVVSRVILTRPPSPRAADPEDLAREAAALTPHGPLTVEPDLDAALELAWSAGRTICVAGSIYLAGAVLARLEGG